MRFSPKNLRRFWQFFTALSLCLTIDTYAQSAPKVLYVGDSIAVETSDTVSWWAKNYSNADTTRAMFGGLAICDFTTSNGGEPTLRTRVKEDRPDVVVLQFVGNRFTTCMQNLPDDEAYYRKYYADAQEATRQIASAAAEVGLARPKILWVLQGPWDNGHTTRMNRQYKEIALLNGDYVSDAGAEVSMAAYHQGEYQVEREKYTRFVPCSDFERNTGYCTDLGQNLARVHKDNDGVHYCLGQVNGFACDQTSPGILRYGMRIAGDIKKLLDGVNPSPNIPAVQAAAHADQARLLYIGDSIAWETVNIVETWAKKNFSATTGRLMWGGLAICDFTDIRPNEINTQLERGILDQRPHVIIMQLVGNALTPCMTAIGDSPEAYWQKYEADANRTAELVTKTAKTLMIPRPIVMWVLQGPSKGTDHLRKMNEIYQRVAKAHGDLTSDAGREVSMAAHPDSHDPADRYVYTQYLPCSDLEIELGYCTDLASKTAKIHKDDDPTHYCLDEMDGFDCKIKSPGELRYGMQIAKDAQKALGL